PVADREPAHAVMNDDHVAVRQRPADLVGGHRHLGLDLLLEAAGERVGVPPDLGGGLAELKPADHERQWHAEKHDRGDRHRERGDQQTAAHASAPALVVSGRAGHLPHAHPGQPTSVAALEPEPDAADRGDVPRVMRVVTEFAAQPGNVHIEGFGGTPPFAVPYLAHDLLAGDYL